MRSHGINKYYCKHILQIIINMKLKDEVLFTYSLIGSCIDLEHFPIVNLKQLHKLFEDNFISENFQHILDYKIFSNIKNYLKICCIGLQNKKVYN